MGYRHVNPIRFLHVSAVHTQFQLFYRQFQFTSEDWIVRELPEITGNCRKLCDNFMQQMKIGVAVTHFLRSTV